MGRLDAFRRASESLVRVKSTWPELFEDFTIEYAKSHPKSQLPFPENPPTRDQIIRRMTTVSNEEARLKKMADQLEMTDREYSLSGRIDKRFREQKFAPVVHAEMILLDWLENVHGGTNPGQFFHRYQYIGSSKPTCRLCHFYFLVHNSGIKVRDTHGNIYDQWKIPDIFAERHSKADKMRTSKVNSLINLLRQDITRILEHKTADRKPHDSNTHTFSLGSWDNQVEAGSEEHGAPDTEQEASSSLCHSSVEDAENSRDDIQHMEQHQRGEEALNKWAAFKAALPEPDQKRRAIQQTMDKRCDNSESEDEDGGVNLLE